MLQWIDPDTGRRKSKSSGTGKDAEAEQARADLEYELNHGRYQEASRMTWERFRELFEEEYLAGLRPNTQENYRFTLDSFEQVCHPARLRSITERTVSYYVTGLRQQVGRGRTGLMPSTIKVRLQYLHTALAWAVAQKMLPTVPVFPCVKVPKKRPQAVPTESFEKLLDRTSDPTMHAYLLCGWLAGLRLDEAFELEWEACERWPYLDLTRNRIILPGEFAKSVEDQWVPLDPALREALEALPRRGRKVFTFVARDGHPIQVGTVSYRVRQLAKAAGVKLTMRSLRRGFGCRHAARVPAQVLQRLMRHADIKTTMVYYANVDTAVEEAILGPQRNSLRNSQPETANRAEDCSDVNPCRDKAVS
jgi:integrase